MGVAVSQKDLTKAGSGLGLAQVSLLSRATETIQTQPPALEELMV